MRSRPFAILLVTFTTFAADGLDAAGGGGGGGGGGASRRVSNCCLGSTSVNHNGSKSRRPIRNNCKTNERRVDHVLLLRCATLESSRLTSNRTSSGAAEARGPLSPGANALLLPSRLFFHLQQPRAYSCAPSISGKANLDIGRPVRTAKWNGERLGLNHVFA